MALYGNLLAGARRLGHAFEPVPQRADAYTLGPEAGEWLQQATLAIRARVPLEVLSDTIQPFPTFSEVYASALEDLRSKIAAASVPAGASAP